MMKKLRRSSLGGDAYAFVRALLLDGDRYGAGDKVSVEELSRELGVSRTPVWAAIYRLEAEGIVEIVPRQGVYLINYDPDKAIEIYLAREVLEGMTARLAAERITKRQILALQANIDAQREHLRKDELDKYCAVSFEFHEEIICVAGNDTLGRLLQSIFAQLKVMRVQTRYTSMQLSRSCDDHERLLEAFRRRDPELAEREARRQVRRLAEEIRRFLPAKLLSSPRMRSAILAHVEAGGGRLEPLVRPAIERSREVGSKT
jgi:DNA-binding GntR family transcriptional regulator